MKAQSYHKAFTLIELLFVIIIMGIVGSMTIEIISQYYNNIYRTSEHTKRVAIANQVLDQVAIYFEYAISDSIVRLDKNIAPSGATCDGVPTTTDSPNDEYTFAFITVDFDGLNGYWNGMMYRPTWVPSVNFQGAAISALDANYTQANAMSALNSATIYDKTVNVSVCNDFRWGTSTSSRYNNINAFTDTNLTLTNSVTDGKDKYLLRSGYAFRVTNGEFRMYQNFQPWQGENYVTNTGQPLATKVAHFSVVYDYTNTAINSNHGGIYKLKLCMYGVNDDLSDANSTTNHDYQICRERGVYVRY